MLKNRAQLDNRVQCVCYYMHFLFALNVVGCLSWDVQSDNALHNDSDVLYLNEYCGILSPFKLYLSFFTRGIEVQFSASTH